MNEIKPKIIIFAFLILIVIVSNAIIPGYTNGFSHYSSLGLSVLWDNPQADYYVNDRMSNPVFKKRIALTGLQRFLKERYSIPSQGSFNILNLGFLVWIILLIYRISRDIYGYSFAHSLWGVNYFLVSMPILFLFSGYTSGYDDFFQFAIILQLFYFFYRGNYVWAALFFLISLMIRETSLIFALPILFIKNDISFRKRLLLVGIPILLFIFYLSQLGTSDDSIRFFFDRRFYAWRSNFSDTDRGLEVVFCLLVVLGIPVRVILYYLKGSRENLLLFLLLTGNTVIVILTALVHETRLLFLPLLLFFPKFGAMIEFKPNFSKVLGFRSISKLSIIAILVIVFYVQSEVGETSIFYDIYAVLSLWILSTFSNFFVLHDSP